MFESIAFVVLYESCMLSIVETVKVEEVLVVCDDNEYRAVVKIMQKQT